MNIKEHLFGAKKSITIWFNGVIGAIWSVVTLIQANPEFIATFQDSLPQLQQYLTPGLYQNITALLVIGNIILRFKTNNSLADKNNK